MLKFEKRTNGRKVKGMDVKEKAAWDTILSLADELPESAAAFLRGYGQGMADANREKDEGAA